jgi:hypothetical protein
LAYLSDDPIPPTSDPMPREGALTLFDVRGPTLTIVCEPCGRRGRYRVEKLMAEHGDVKLTELLATLADCPKPRSVSIYDRCQVRYERYYGS